MIKSRAAKDRASVTFTVDPRAGARTAAVCGEWNEWSADADVMHRDAEGGFSVTVDLDAGRAYRFRYLLDGQRWDNTEVNPALRLIESSHTLPLTLYKRSKWCPV